MIKVSSECQNTWFKSCQGTLLGTHHLPGGFSYVSGTAPWQAMSSDVSTEIYCTFIDAPERVNHTHFGKPLTFSLSRPVFLFIYLLGLSCTLCQVLVSISKHARWWNMVKCWTSVSCFFIWMCSWWHDTNLMGLLHSSQQGYGWSWFNQSIMRDWW